MSSTVDWNCCPGTVAVPAVAAASTLGRRDNISSLDFNLCWWNGKPHDGIVSVIEFEFEFEFEFSVELEAHGAYTQIHRGKELCCPASCCLLPAGCLSRKIIWLWRRVGLSASHQQHQRTKTSPKNERSFSRDPSQFHGYRCIMRWLRTKVVHSNGWQEVAGSTEASYKYVLQGILRVYLSKHPSSFDRCKR